MDDRREILPALLDALLPGLPTGAVTTSTGLSELRLDRPPSGVCDPGTAMGRVIGLPPDDEPEKGSDFERFR